MCIFQSQVYIPAFIRIRRHTISRTRFDRCGGRLCTFSNRLNTAKRTLFKRRGVGKSALFENITIPLAYYYASLEQEMMATSAVVVKFYLRDTPPFHPLPLLSLPPLPPLPFEWGPGACCRKIFDIIYARR
jgi:hypothetical protein